jgi:hypothetical protein
VLIFCTIALALTVPAIAGPANWDMLSAFGFGDDDNAAELVPMPFETAGENFPGSAFYYLEEAPRLAFDIEELRSEEATMVSDSAAALALPSLDPTEAAQGFRSAGSGLDKARALQCLSMAVYYEAASESYNGQRAVAQVVLNRVAHPSYPSSVCGVVFQGSERVTGCQFSFTCDGSLKRTPTRRNWAVAQSVSLAALAGGVFADVGTATHYHATYVDPYWAPSLDPVGTIGLHRFYRWKGRAGKPDAFSIRYAGGEPAAVPKQRSADAFDASAIPAGVEAGVFIPADPSAVAATAAEAAAGAVGGANTRATASGSLGLEADRAAGQLAQPGVSASPSDNANILPASPNDNLPQSGSVKPEYANSGKWINDPGK